MKFIIAATTWLSAANAFSPASHYHQSVPSSLTSLNAAIAPERVAPDAGYVPDWDNRTGKPPEEFMQSDMDKPDLSGMWECPLTRWDSEG